MQIRLHCDDITVHWHSVLCNYRINFHGIAVFHESFICKFLCILHIVGPSPHFRLAIHDSAKWYIFVNSRKCPTIILYNMPPPSRSLPVSRALSTKLLAPLQIKVEEWKKTTATLEREHDKGQRSFETQSV